MKIGKLGEIIFEVSDTVVQTISNMTWTGKARYGTHQRHLSSALTEFQGTDPDTITFDITLSAYLGVNPQKTITQMWVYERSGETLPLVIGNKAYGRYRWTLETHKIKMQHFDGDGDLSSATVSVTLKDYVAR